MTVNILDVTGPTPGWAFGDYLEYKVKLEGEFTLMGKFKDLYENKQNKSALEKQVAEYVQENNIEWDNTQMNLILDFEPDGSNTVVVVRAFD